MSVLQKIIEEFAEAILNHGNKKNYIVLFILGLIVLMVYWFLGIFLLAPKFYSENNVWISVLFSFAFSFIWLLINIVNSFIGLFSSEDELSLNNVIFRAALFSIVSILIALFLSEGILRLPKVAEKIRPIKAMIFISFGSIIVLIIIKIILLAIFKLFKKSNH